jgi:hypothetical protein
MAQSVHKSTQGSVPNANPSKCLSHIRFVDLNDRIQPWPGDYSTISILNPVIYIEREEIDSKKQEFEFMEELDHNKEHSLDSNALNSIHQMHDLRWNVAKSYRINVSFNLEVEIKDFDSGYVLLWLIPTRFDVPKIPFFQQVLRFHVIALSFQGRRRRRVRSCQ